MIKQILDKWIGEDTENYIINNIDEFNNRDDAMYKGEMIGMNLVRQSIRSKIPQIEQEILEEIKKEIIGFIDSGYFSPTTDTGWSIDLDDVKDFINQLKSKE